MGLEDYILPMVFLCLAILLVAQTSITIKSYSSTGKAKDTNYYWSIFVLVISIIGLLASFFLIYKASTGVSITGNGNGNGENGEFLDPVNVGALGTSGNASAIDALRAKLATNKGNIMTKLDTELATKLAQLEQARNVLAAYTKGAAAAVTTAV
jgi:hypothetical protein